MNTESEHPIENDVVSKALNLIDPSGTLVPATVEYQTVRDMILRWIDECGSEYALCMAEIGAEHLERWRRYL